MRKAILIVVTAMSGCVASPAFADTPRWADGTFGIEKSYAQSVALRHDRADPPKIKKPTRTRPAPKRKVPRNPAAPEKRVARAVYTGRTFEHPADRAPTCIATMTAVGTEHYEAADARLAADRALMAAIRHLHGTRYMTPEAWMSVSYECTRSSPGVRASDRAGEAARGGAIIECRVTATPCRTRSIAKESSR